MVCNNSFDNQHKTTIKFARRWFGSYVELDGSRLAIPIAGKRLKIFKKRQGEGPKLDDLNNEDSNAKPTNVSKVNEDVEESHIVDEISHSLLGTYWRMCDVVGVDVVKIFGNGVKITWNEENREGAICTCMEGVMVNVHV